MARNPAVDAALASFISNNVPLTYVVRKFGVTRQAVAKRLATEYPIRRAHDEPYPCESCGAKRLCAQRVQRRQFVLCEVHYRGGEV